MMRCRPGLFEAVADEIFTRVLGRKFGQFSFDFAADGGDGGVGLAREGTGAVFFFNLVQPRGVFFSEIQNQQHRFLGEKLKAPDALLVILIEFEIAQRDVRVERLFAADQQFEFFIEVGVAGLFAVAVHAIHALLDDSHIAEDEFGFDIVEVTRGVDRAVLVGHSLILKDAENVSERIHYAKAGEVGGIAQGFFRNCRRIDIFDGRIADFRRLV